MNVGPQPQSPRKVPSLPVSGPAGDFIFVTATGNSYIANEAGTYELVAVGAVATGDVVGPASSTDNALARFDSTTGKLLQNSLATVSDAGTVNIPAGQTYNIDGVPVGGGGSPNITIPMLLSSTEVNLNEGTAAKQPLYTCPANRRCVVTNIVMQKFSAGADLAAGNLGWDAGATNVGNGFDFGARSAGPTFALLSGVYGSADGGVILSPTPVIGTAGDILGLKVTTPQGSALTVKVDIFGYWTDTNGVPIANVVGTAP